MLLPPPAGPPLPQLANVLTAFVLGSAALFLHQCYVGRPAGAALQPPIVYLGLLVLLLFPGGILFRDTRHFFGSTLWRVFTPLRYVTWSDFLLADILTSLAKGLSDTERAVCHMMTGPVMNPQERACSDASFIIPLGLAMPYAWRLVQCLRVFLDTGARPQIFNAIKYSTTFPVRLPAPGSPGGWLHSRGLPSAYPVSGQRAHTWVGAGCIRGPIFEGARKRLLGADQASSPAWLMAGGLLVDCCLAGGACLPMLRLPSRAAPASQASHLLAAPRHGRLGKPMWRCVLAMSPAPTGKQCGGWQLRGVLR